MGGIKFAPLKIPLRRRLQTAIVLYFTVQFLFLSFFFGLILVYLLTTRYYYLTLIYFAWYYLDFDTYQQGGRRREFFRRLFVWKWFAEYFPIKLVKTVDLSPDKNYIIGCHPHGILCFSHYVNFATEGTGFSSMFPNIRPHLITLNYQFYLPLHREIIGASGACGASKKSLEHILTKQGTGNVAALITGGAIEVLDSIPGKIILTLKRRKGFIRVAIKSGASLVPSMSFGENDLFIPVTKEASFLRKIQEKLVKVFTFAIPLVNGRGVFQYSFGLMPFRKPVVTVIGAPIDTVANPNPTDEEVDRVHQEYIAAVEKLFYENKSKYGFDDTTLTIK